MARGIRKKRETSSAMRIASNERSRTEIGNGRPSLAIVTTILSGPIALITIPVFWFLGMTFFHAVLLTIVIQLAIFPVVVMIGLYRLFGDEADESFSEISDNTALPDLKIWRSYSHDGTNDDAPLVALIADDSVQTQQIATDLARQGYDIHQTNDVDAMLETVQTRPIDWNFMIFDLDLLDDLESNVDDLIVFRDTCARIPILLLSGSSSRDEFSDHRRAIGDATLRKPVFRSRLLAGIDAMKANWQGAGFRLGG